MSERNDGRQPVLCRTNFDDRLWIGNTFIELTPADGSLQFAPIFAGGTVDVRVSTDVDDDPHSTLPADFRLEQNYPNPFNPSTIIEFSLPVRSRVRLDVFNVLGQNVRTMINNTLPAGLHKVEFDGRSQNGGSLATGIYFYRLTTEQNTATRKMLLIK